MRRLTPILLACLTICLAGCSNHSDYGGDVDVTERAVPVPYSGPTPSSNLLGPSAVPSSDASSDPIMNGGEAMAGGNRSSEGRDALAGEDPMKPSHDLSSQDDPLTGTRSGNRKFGWYWLRGTAHDGLVSVAINGATCGEFSDFTDREVTRYIKPGLNRVTFTSTPTSAVRSMDVHFVVYMRAASADVHQTVPAAVYDRTTPNPLIAPQDSTVVSTPLTAAPAGTVDPVAPTHTLPQAAPSQTRVLTFFAK